MKAVLFLHVLYLIFIKSFMVKGATKCGSQVELRAVLLSCPARDNGCEENDLLSQTMDAEQEQLLQANGRNFESLKEKRTRGFPNAVRDCKRKLVVTMKVKNVGKIHCEDKYIVVDHVYDPVTGGRGRLLSPIVLKLRQEQMVQLYGLQFERVVNSDPYEQQLTKSKFCSVSPDNPTCGITTYNGKPIPFSEGFCCSCTPHVNAKRQISSVSHGDSFTHRDSNLFSQGHSYLTRQVQPIFTNPQLVRLRSKKASDYTKTQQECLKRLNSNEIPNYLLENDRKIICDKGDFMTELCKLREEKMKLKLEAENYRNEQYLTEQAKFVETLQTKGGNLERPVTTQASVSLTLSSRFAQKDSVDVLNTEPKAMPRTEFKGSRGKRENRYEMEDNSLEKNLERFLRTKKLYRNRRKRLLEIPHRRNQKVPSNLNDCMEPEFPDKDYVKPLPPMFFFSHDKVIINPMEATKSNFTNKSPMESAYNGLKYALEQNRFDTKWDKNGRKTHQRFRGKGSQGTAPYDMNNNMARENVKAPNYSLDDNLFRNEQRFKFQTENQAREMEGKNQKDEQRDKTEDAYFRNKKMKNDERQNIRNYFLDRTKDFMNNNKLPETAGDEEKAKNAMKDYNEDSKEMKENAENGYGTVRKNMRNFKGGKKVFEHSQISDKTVQEKYQTDRKQKYYNRKFVQAPQGRYRGFPLRSKDGDEAFDFNVEITHQDYPVANRPRFRFKSSAQHQLNNPGIHSPLWKTKSNQLYSKPPHYLFFEQDRINSPQNLYIIGKENAPVKFRSPHFHLKEPETMTAERERCRVPTSYYRKQPNYFGPSPHNLEWPATRPRQFQPSHDRHRANDHPEYDHTSENSQKDSEEEPTKKIRERRSVKEFEPAKGYLASDAYSGRNVAPPHELDICPVETVKKPPGVKPIDIKAEILSGLPKLKRKMARLDNKKAQRSSKTDLDRLIQSYLNAPDYVLKQVEILKEEGREEKQNQKEPVNSTCGKSLEGEYTQETAHCMRFGDLWYSMYSIRKPEVAQIVGLQVFDKRTLHDGRTKWKELTKGKMIRLGTFLSSAEDNLPSVSFTFTGEESDVLSSPIDPDNYVLLVPSHLSDPSKANFYPQLEGGPAEYLLVNRKYVSSGADCNKIGTSFEAFTRQPGRCDHFLGSCLKQQPTDLWRQDMEARIRGKRGKYFVENFGTVPDSPIKTFTNLTGEYLAMEYYGDYSSTIEVELKADHNLIVRKGRSNAQIPTVFIDGTYPKKTRIYMSVLNTGLTSSNFRPRLGDCPPDINPSWCPLEGFPVTIPPQKRHDFKLDLSGSLPANNLHATVQVLNQDNQPIAQRKIRIKRGERCICAFHCKCNCMGDPAEGKTCGKLNEDDYRAAGYVGSPPYRPGPFVSKGFFANLRLVFVTASYILIMFGVLKGILGAYFRPLGIAGVGIITGPRKLSRYYEPELQNCTVQHDELGFPIHPTTCRPVQMVPLCCEIILNVFFFFLYPIRGFWLILKSSICLKIVFGDKASSRQERNPDHKCSSPLLSQQNTCLDYNLTTFISKSCPADEFLPYLPYRGDNDPLEEDDTEFVLQEMQKHKKN